MFLKHIVSRFQRTLCGLHKYSSANPALGIQCFSLILPLAFCSSENIKKIELSSSDKLTHRFLLRQASNVAANSASQLLNQTITAIIDTAEEYKKCLNDLMSLVDKCQTNLANDIIQEEISDLMLEYRSKVNNYKSQFVELESLLEYVEKVVVSTSETTFLVGAEYSSFSLSEHLHSVKQEVMRIKEEVKNLERDYLEMQQILIESTSKFDENKQKKKED